MKQNKSKGQNLVEFATLGLLVLTICLVAIFFFGDSIALLFSQHNGNTLFNGTSRTDIDNAFN